MAFPESLKATLKAFIQNDSVLGPKATAGDYDFIANALNTLVEPAYWCWQTSMDRTEIYKTISDQNSAWNWGTFKAQALAEQATWREMFMGSDMDFSQLNNRNGIFNIFSGSAAANNQRAHIFAVGRRKVNLLEKIFAIAPISGGGITVGADNGNDGIALNRGKTTNPDILTFEGTIGAGEIGGVLS